MTAPQTSRQGAIKAAQANERARLLARLHVIAAKAKLDTDAYRDILQEYTRSDQSTGVRSAVDLDLKTLRVVVAKFAALEARQAGKKPRGVHRPSGGSPDPKEWAWINAAPEDKRPLLRKIYACCSAIGVGQSYAEGVARRQSGGEEKRLQWLTYAELHKLAAALNRTSTYRKTRTPGSSQ